MHNLRTMSANDIEKLYVAKVNKVQITRNQYPAKRVDKPVPFDYQKMKQKSALERSQAGRLISCLVLSKTTDERFLPFDPFEAKHFLGITSNVQKKK